MLEPNQPPGGERRGETSSVGDVARFYIDS
jgi:hypothetical protein